MSAACGSRDWLRSSARSWAAGSRRCTPSPGRLERRPGYPNEGPGITASISRGAPHHSAAPRESRGLRPRRRPAVVGHRAVRRSGIALERVGSVLRGSTGHPRPRRLPPEERPPTNRSTRAPVCSCWIGRPPAGDHPRWIWRRHVVPTRAIMWISRPSCRSHTNPGVNLDSQEIGRAVAVGTIFRRLAAMDWASADLAFHDVSRPVARLQIYRSEVLEAIQAAMPGQLPTNS